MADDYKPRAKPKDIDDETRAAWAAATRHAEQMQALRDHLGSLDPVFRRPFARRELDQLDEAQLRSLIREVEERQEALAVREYLRGTGKYSKGELDGMTPEQLAEEITDEGDRKFMGSGSRVKPEHIADWASTHGRARRDRARQGLSRRHGTVGPRRSRADDRRTGPRRGRDARGEHADGSNSAVDPAHTRLWLEKEAQYRASVGATETDTKPTNPLTGVTDRFRPSPGATGTTTGTGTSAGTDPTAGPGDPSATGTGSTGSGQQPSTGTSSGGASGGTTDPSPPKADSTTGGTDTTGSGTGGGGTTGDGQGGGWQATGATGTLENGPHAGEQATIDEDPATGALHAVTDDDAVAD